MRKNEVPKWFTEAVSFPFQKRFLTASGCALSYVVWGEPDKPPVVLVHGGAAHAMWWTAVAPELSRHYYVIAPDLSGHGDSGRREAYSLETWADEVIAVSEDAARGRPPVLVGHSMGGRVSIAAAAAYRGERLAGVVIVDSPLGEPDPESDRDKDGRTFRTQKTYPDLQTAISHFRLIPEQPCDRHYILDHIARHSLVQTQPGWTWKFDPRVLSQFPPTKTLRDYLPRVDCRLALIRGEFSAIVSPEAGEYMRGLLSRSAPLVEIPQAHHHLILDQPLEFIAALRALLASWGHSASWYPKR